MQAQLGAAWELLGFVTKASNRSRKCSIVALGYQLEDGAQTRSMPAMLTDFLQRHGALLVMLALTLASFLILRHLQPDLFASHPTARHVPDFYMENFVTTTMDENGLPKRRVEAEYMAHFPDTDTHEFQRPDMLIYRPQGSPWHVQSERGWLSSSGDVMLLLGKVHIWRNAQEQAGGKALDVRTEDLRVLPDREYGETDKPVKITTPGSTTTGTGMRANLAENRLEVLNDVQTHYKPKQQN